MPIPVAEAWRGSCTPPDSVLRLLAIYLDIQSVWSLDHQPADLSARATLGRLLAFADERTLMRLRTNENLHIPDVEFLVVVDGDVFASAWGPCNVSGSLARWAWRETSPHEAFYDESRWSSDEAEVIRVRRKAFLTWRA